MFLAVLLTGLMDASTAKAIAAPADRPPEAFTLFASNNRLLAMLRIGFAPPVPVVFDTGTNENILDLKYADALHLAPRRGDRARQVGAISGQWRPCGIETFGTTDCGTSRSHLRPGGDPFDARLSDSSG